MRTLADLIRLARPLQWVKNLFVLTGVLFGHAWSETAKLAPALAATVAFCLVASAVYAFNDIADRDRDALHPVKRQRPLAARRLSVPTAAGFSVTFAAAGFACALLASAQVLWLILGYLALNLAYSARLKHVPVLDVFAIAAGFMLRILAGTFGIGIPPSHWLLICGMMIALFLGFTKRRAELASSHDDRHAQRGVLQHYDPALLDSLITITGTGTVITYALYSLSRETIAMHGTANLIYTVPLIVYGVMRVIYRLHAVGQGENPARELLGDPHLVVTFLLWVALTAYLIY